MTAWSVNAEVLEPGWFEIPDLAEPELSDWSAEVASALRTFWGPEWNSDVESRVRSDLERAQRLRPDNANLTVAYWPPFSDLFFGVRVLSGRAPQVEQWADDGYELRSYEAQNLGAGVECISVDPILRESGSGVDIQVVVADYVFVQGPRCVTVSLDPMPVNYFVMMRSGIDQFLQSLEVFSEDGETFRGEAVDCGQVALAGDVWGLPE
ncbi:hypothetical protein [Nocardioides albertanoniae]|uniref:hypothetical protein n=1 Tax=Nocardioides albertanoniae TaxID=1175486 RepID=UPI001151D3D8|nr:hypothetical protein [Nocardioides albertanoniae]